MKKWLYWTLIVLIVLVVLSIIYGLVFGFGGEGSNILLGNISEDSMIGRVLTWVEKIFN